MRRILLVLAILLAPVAANAAVGTIFLDTAADGALSTNSGTSDASAATATGTTSAVATAAVTLDVNTNLVSCGTGCPVAQDSSQAILISGATNVNIKIFWIASFAGCTGTGSCVLTLSGSGTGAGTNAALPTGCTTTCGSWAIGGRMTVTGANYEANVRPGDTLMVNTDLPSSASTLITQRVSGDSTTGFIFLKGKVGVDHPLLTVSGAVNVLGAGSAANWWIENVTLSSTGTGGIVGTQTGQNMVFNNVRWTKTSGGGSVANITDNGTVLIINSEFNISSGTGACFSSTFAAAQIISTYFHGCGGDAIVNGATSPTIKIINNIIASSTGSGINLSGASTTQAGGAVIYGNTIYNNATAGLTVADNDTAVFLFNNIIQNDGAHPSVIWTAGTGQLVSMHGWNDIYTPGSSNTNFTLNATEISTNPLLTNPGSGDFTLQSNSPAINLTGTLGLPGTFLSVSGVTKAFPDLGAVAAPGGSGGSHCIGC